MRIAIVTDAVLVVVRLSNVVSICSFLIKADGCKLRYRISFCSRCCCDVLSINSRKRSTCCYSRYFECELGVVKVIAIRFIRPAIEVLCNFEVSLNGSKCIGNYQRICLLAVIGNSCDRQLVLYCHSRPDSSYVAR